MSAYTSWHWSSVTVPMCIAMSFCVFGMYSCLKKMLSYTSHLEENFWELLTRDLQLDLVHRENVNIKWNSSERTWDLYLHRCIHRMLLWVKTQRSVSCGLILAKTCNLGIQRSYSLDGRWSRSWSDIPAMLPYRTDGKAAVYPMFFYIKHDMLERLKQVSV